MNELRTRLRWAAWVLPSLVLAGCFVPEPANPMTVAPGSRVQIALTPQGQARLHAFAVRESEEVAGRLVSVTHDSIAITARMARASSADRAPSSLRQTLTFGHVDVRQVSVPTLHRGRTVAVVGGALVLIGLLVADVFDFRGSAPGSEPAPPESPFRPWR